MKACNRVMKNRRIYAAVFLFIAAIPFSISPSFAAEFRTGDAGGIIGIRILAPLNNESAYGSGIDFAGICIGAGGCDMLSVYTLTWFSSRDGVIGNGLTFSTQSLSVGDHIIEFRASNGAQTFSDTMPMTIKEVPLTANIDSANPEGFYSEGNEISLEANAFGGRRPYTYSWKIGNGYAGSETAISKTLPPGRYEVELSVRDSAGSEAKSYCSLDIAARTAIQDQPMAVYIESPTRSQVFKDSSEIPFRAGVSGGKQPYTYVWTTDDGKVIGLGYDFSAKNVSKGGHRMIKVQVKVIDSTGSTATDETEIVIEPLCVRDGVCSRDENYTNCPEDCEGAKDRFCDGVRDGVCDPDCNRTDDPDCVCNKNGVCEQGLEDYMNCPDDCLPGSMDDYCDKTKDGVCDPDCKKGEDPDCNTDYTNYFILAVFVLVIIVVYAKYIRNRTT